MILGEARETVEVSATVQAVSQKTPHWEPSLIAVPSGIFPFLPGTTRQILTMSTGVVADVSNAANLGNGTQDFYVNGASNTSNNFQMDGSDVNNFGSGRAGTFLQQGGIPIPNPDAIQEFKIQTSLYDAGYGRGAGANVEVITKSGSNQLHGSVFEFLRNDKLDCQRFLPQSTKSAPLGDEAEPVRRQPGRSDHQRQILHLRLLPGDSAGERVERRLTFIELTTPAYR